MKIFTAITASFFLLASSPLFSSEAMADSAHPNHARKHVQTRDPGVNARQHIQKDRIKQGVRSGELTKDEVKDLRAERKAIRDKEQEYKSDGKLTRDERKDLHQDLNESSKHIYQEKHDADKR